MDAIYTIIFYTLSFLSVYVQIFFLITFLEKRRHIVYHPDNLTLGTYPRVTVTVPCYNEEHTINKTVESLLALDYPQDKLSIFLVDDGSTDGTWEKIKSYESHPMIRVFQKENGGKHTALNVGLLNADSEFVGCLDADSFVHPQALKRIMKTFENHSQTMAIAPSIIVYNPKNMIQTAQKVEYDMAVYTKKMLGFMGGIHVTPGPFSIFRRKVFDDLGPYRKAHNTEDQEIALRMQEHGYKIDHCPDAYVYTTAPNSVGKLYRQRIRWIYGFIKNLIDYRRLVFRKKYGTIALFTLPSGFISIVGVIFLFSTVIYNIGSYVHRKFIQIQTVGIESTPAFHFDWFFIDTQAALFFSIILYILVIVSVVLGRRMAEGRAGFSLTIFYFIIIYSIIAPFWLLRAIYNALRSHEASWTLERQATKAQ
ncbi:MAG: glycosyltransferase family 2 protein [Candidatus Pacebacteria bacterium]|nr:glycosyltransferase family 2 protein [Candidatus Paceibacterota bacterium]